MMKRDEVIDAIKLLNRWRDLDWHLRHGGPDVELDKAIHNLHGNLLSGGELSAAKARASNAVDEYLRVLRGGTEDDLKKLGIEIEADEST